MTSSAVNHYSNLIMNNLFAYGTLMCEDIMQEVAQCLSQKCQGALTGYSRRSVKGAVYPALIPDEKGIVDGILFKGIPDEAWERLDQFEGKMYLRQSVQIILPDETTVLAETYVIRPEYIDHLENAEWNFENFLRHYRSGFQKE